MQNRLPWWFGFPLSAGAWLMGAFPPSFLPDLARLCLFVLGAVLFVWGLFGAFWHYKGRQRQPESDAASERQSPLGGGGGASRTPDGTVSGGHGGHGQFWGAGGGGGGGLRVNPDGSIEAGGGGGGGGITEGGHGGGDLGGGGGGAPGFPPGYFETEQGKFLLLTWEMTQQYKLESGTDDNPPTEWGNAWLDARGVNLVYTRDDNGMSFKPK